jgi:hypothetical protein
MQQLYGQRGGWFKKAKGKRQKAEGKRQNPLVNAAARIPVKEHSKREKAKGRR